MTLVPLWPVLEFYEWNPPYDRGYWQTIKCHVHKDSRASCRASSNIGYVACMSCGFKGDGIAIIRHYEGLGFLEAVAFAERIPGVGNVVLRAGTSGQSGGRLSGGSRDRRDSGRYVPPRLRGRSGSGA